LPIEEKIGCWEMQMEVEGGRNGKSSRFEGKGRVKITSVVLSFL
jgi:hypothetical protein